MKFSNSIPFATVLVLLLTLFINIIGLRFSLEKHFPIYIESIQQQLKKENEIDIDPKNLEGIFSVHKLDEKTQEEYAEAIFELSQIASSLESLSKNPELYISNGENTNPSTNALHISLSPNILNNSNHEVYHKGIISIFSAPFSFEKDTPEWQFSIKIIQNFFILNSIWIIIVIFVYLIWMRRVFRPIHLVIDLLKNFSTSKNIGRISYKKRDEFRPLIETLNELYASLGNQEKIRNQFLSDLSHEIRTPMTAISCLLEAIDDGIMELDKTTILTLQKEMHRLVQITEHIMKNEDFLSEQNIDSKKEMFNLKKIINEIILQYQPKLQKNQQNIFEKFSHSDSIYTNSEQFIQILHNIFSNFCKYAGKHSNLSCFLKEEKNVYIITFSDTGIGISNDELPFLTEKFYKSDVGRTQKTDELSMGIGLALVSKIMTLHSGSLKLEHTKPHGLTIILTFPKHEKKLFP